MCTRRRPACGVRYRGATVARRPEVAAKWRIGRSVATTLRGPIGPTADAPPSPAPPPYSSAVGGLGRQEDTTMTDTLWILGAPDPEMQAIETLLRECGEHVAYALDERGERVHAGNAYQAARPPVSDGQYDVVYAVECGGDWFGALNVWSPYDDDGGPVLTGCIRIDHHRPGDPGYGRPPSEFFAASSLGQVCAVLGLAILYSHRDDACRVLSDQ